MGGADSTPTASGLGLCPLAHEMLYPPIGVGQHELGLRKRALGWAGSHSGPPDLPGDRSVLFDDSPDSDVVQLVCQQVLVQNALAPVLDGHGPGRYGLSRIVPNANPQRALSLMAAWPGGGCSMTSTITFPSRPRPRAQAVMAWTVPPRCSAQNSVRLRTRRRPEAASNRAWKQGVRLQSWSAWQWREREDCSSVMATRGFFL